MQLKDEGKLEREDRIMASASPTTSFVSFNDPEIQRQVNELRQADNVSSWFYLAREYACLALIIGATIAFYDWLQAAQFSWLWAIPVTLLAIAFIGALQQRLATLTHEAAHYMLFRNRLLNEIASELFCMFPIYGTTHSYRVQHLGHHQYPNDPERDPDWVQMTRSGHRYQFPMTKLQFLWHCVIKQIVIPLYLVRYALVRASYVVDKGEGTPYRMIRRQSLKLRLAGMLYLFTLVGSLAALVWQGDPLLLGMVSLGLWLAAMLFFAFAPNLWLEEFFIKSDLPVRVQKCLRITFNALVLTGVAFLTLATGKPWWMYYVVLWMIPLGTSFAFFMILRQIVQHGNADQERYTNTRIFKAHWLLSWAIFPIGNDYHLPHHLFPMVPHYNLRKLHELLMRTEEYRNNALIVEGYFVHPEMPPAHPTVMDVMTTAQA
jgi:fatty acid desaturase